MKVILFGATGMVGQGVLRECLVDPDVESVLVVGRSPTSQKHAKLREILHDNFMDFSKIESELRGYDACFFCLGVSSVGMDAERYRHLTYDVTMAAANTLVRLNPNMVFTYVTGRSTDSTEQGPLRWARVKGKTENDLLKLPFKAAYMFRPAGIQPLHGVHHPGQQRRGEGIDRVDPAGLRPHTMQRLDAVGTEHVGGLERQLEQVVLGLALDPRPHQAALLG